MNDDLYNENNPGEVLWVEHKDTGEQMTCYTYYLPRMIAKGYKQIATPRRSKNPSSLVQVSVREAAAVLGVKDHTIRNMISAGKLKNISDEKGTVILSLAEVEKHLS